MLKGLAQRWRSENCIQAGIKTRTEDQLMMHDHTYVAKCPKCEECAECSLDPKYHYLVDQDVPKLLTSKNSHPSID